MEKGDESKTVLYSSKKKYNMKKYKRRTLKRDIFTPFKLLKQPNKIKTPTIGHTYLSNKKKMEILNNTDFT